MQERRILLNNNKVPEGTVDLGLPSGVLWVKGNICKDSNGNYYMGEETDYGCYFSWGNIVGHNNGEGYEFSDTSYSSTSGRSVTENIASNDAQHDAALACLGSPWRMPTKEEFQELLDNTDYEWTAINGVNGAKFMKKTDHSVYVFFPASGYVYYLNINVLGSVGDYWTSSYYSAAHVYILQVKSSSPNAESHTSRYFGFVVRAVRSTT